jgi:magnesium transporter
VSSNQVDLPEDANPGFETLTAEGLDGLRDLMRAGDAKALFGELEGLHESDIAEIISLLTPEQRLVFMGLVGEDIPAAVFPELDEHIRDEIIEFVDLKKMVSTVRELDSDDAVFVLEDMDVEDR